MNRTALALLQGRLWRAAVHFDDRLHRAAELETPSAPVDIHLHDNEEVTTPQDDFLEAELCAVLRALDRIENGVYGLCESCGQAIDPNRLFARPQQLACNTCADAQPSAKTMLEADRRATPGDTLPAPARFASLRHRPGRSDEAHAKHAP